MQKKCFKFSSILKFSSDIRICKNPNPVNSKASQLEELEESLRVSFFCWLIILVILYGAVVFKYVRLLNDYVNEPLLCEHFSVPMLPLSPPPL